MKWNARQIPETVGNLWKMHKFQGECMRNTWSNGNILASVLMTSFKCICPSSLLLDGSRVSFQGTKRPGCEADCLPPTRSRIKKEWRCTTVPPNCLQGETRHKFIFYIRISFVSFTFTLVRLPDPRHTQINTSGQMTAQHALQMYFIK